MGQALSLAFREQIVQLRQTGKKFTEISRELDIPYSTIRQIWGRFKEKGLAGLGADYQNCGRKESPYKAVKRVGIWLRRLHPNWGAAYICMILVDRYGEEAVPSARTLQYAFKQAGLNKLRPIRTVSEKKKSKRFMMNGK